MLYFSERVEEKVIRAIFTKIQQHHDVLRMTFTREGDQIIQTCHGLEYPLGIEEVDFRGSGAGEDEVQVWVEQKVDESQTSIDLERGPLMKTTLFHLEKGDYLLLILHHLVVDGVSWRILLEDLETLYRQYKHGEPLALPLKTDSFKLWSEKLSLYADSSEFLKERSYWEGVIEAAAGILPIPRDFPGTDKILEDSDQVSFQLDEAETEKLLTRVNQAFATETNDMLLTSLALAIANVYGHDAICIALEGHGREEILDGIDISRTVGFFTSEYPVILDMSYKTEMARQIKEVKESLRRKPHRGIGYGILRYLTGAENK
jgi:hypothetical protein